MHVLVLGAGVTGVTTAWYLRRAGFEVTLVDRQSGAGLETSFANGGQISVSHPEPWSSPAAPLQILRWLGRADAPIAWHPRASLAQWRWASAFLRECLPGRHAHNTRTIAALALHSRACLRALREELQLEYQQQTRGILHIFRQQHEWQAVQARQQRLASLGIDTEVCSVERCIAIEPALAHLASAASTDKLLGGLYAPDDESGNARQFSQQLVRHAQNAGVRLAFGHTIKALDHDGKHIRGVWCATADNPHTHLAADAIVVCLASQANSVLKSVGMRLPIYPLKGYSITVDLPDTRPAPFVSLTDESRRIVSSRLGTQLRIAGTAELGGYALDLKPQRYLPLLAWLRDAFAIEIAPQHANVWAGLRPATPSNCPIIQRSTIENLWFNTGHGTLGWTLACGSAEMISRQMAAQLLK